MPQATTQGSPLSLLAAPRRGNEEEAVRFLDSLFSYLRDQKKGHEYHWRECVLMIAREHWLDFDPITGKFSAANLADWVPTPTTNKMGKIYDRGVDLFTSGDLRPRVRPATDDQADIGSAQTGQRILHYLFDPAVLNTGEKQRLAAGHLWAFGNTILKALWNPRSRKKTAIPRMGLVAAGPVILPNGETLMREDQPGVPFQDMRLTQEKNDRGEPVFDLVDLGAHYEAVVSPFSYFPEAVENIEDVTHAIEAEAVTLDVIADLFGSAAVKDVNAEEIDLFGWGLFQADNVVIGTRNESSSHHVMMKTFRSKPCEKFPDGRTIIVAGGKRLFDERLEDYLDGELPWEHIPFRRIPGDLWGYTPLRDAIPLQKRLNAIDSTIVQNRKLFINPQVIEPKGSNLGPIDGRAGARIIWDWKQTGGHSPQVKPSIGLHPSVMQEREIVSRELEDLAGTVEILSGSQPSGVTTFGQTQLLAEQALRRFAPPVRAWKRGLSRHERRKLMIAKARWRDERIVRVVGENEAIEVFHYSGADIGTAQDVVIEQEGAIVFSEAIEQQKILEGIKMGLIDPRNPAIAGRVLQLLNIPGFANQFTLDAKMTRRRIKAILDGSTVTDLTTGQRGDITARSNDNHAICYEILSDYTKEAEFEDLAPEAQTNIARLMTQHQQALAATQQQAMQAAQAVKGTGNRATEAVADAGAFGGGQDSQASEVAPTL